MPTPTFTKADMDRLYAEHGERLVMFDGDGDGPFSANPADYWQAKPDTVFQGALAVRIPERFEAVAV